MVECHNRLNTLGGTMKDTAIILCARLESSRLPKKCFRMVGGLPAVEHTLKRLSQTGLKTILAIPTGQKKNFAPTAKSYCAEVYEGRPDSPLHRIADWLIKNKGVKYVVRVTHDDLIIDPITIKEMVVTAHKEKAGYVFCSNIVEGAGVEVICRANLLHAAKQNLATEFISYFVRGEGMPNPSIVEHKARTAVARPYRLTMDYYEDWIVLNRIFWMLGDDATTEQICHFLDFHPSLLNINKLPTLSIYTCAFNSGKTISATINSVLPQLGLDDEYIIVNDGSTDNTLEEIAKFHDPRIKLISNEQNLGLASSSNIAINKARGKYIMRVDADDALLPEFHISFYYMYSEITKGAIVVYPAHHRLFENGIEWTRTISGKENHHAGCALMLRSAINEFRFKEGLRHWDGLELYKRISQKKGAIAYCSIPTFLYRISNVSMSKSEPEKRAEMLITLGLKGLASA